MPEDRDIVMLSSFLPSIFSSYASFATIVGKDLGACFVASSFFCASKDSETPFGDSVLAAVVPQDSQVWNAKSFADEQRKCMFIAVVFFQPDLRS